MVPAMPRRADKGRCEESLSGVAPPLKDSRAEGIAGILVRLDVRHRNIRDRVSLDIRFRRDDRSILMRRFGACPFALERLDHRILNHASAFRVYGMSGVGV